MKIRVRASALLKEPYLPKYLVRYNVEEMPDKRWAFVKHSIPAMTLLSGIWIVSLVILMDHEPVARSALVFLPGQTLLDTDGTSVLINILSVMACVLVGGSTGILIARGDTVYTTYFSRVPQGRVVDMSMGIFQTPYVVIRGYTYTNKLRDYKCSINRKSWDNIDVGDFIDIN